MALRPVGLLAFLGLALVTALRATGAEISESSRAKTTSTPNESSLGVTLGFASWQQPGVLLGPDGTGYPLMANLRATELGFEWRKSSRGNLEFGFGVWGYLGSGDLGAPTSAAVTLPVSYAPTGVASRGAAGEATLGLRPGHDRVVLGPRISVLYESSDWPTPDGGSTVSSSRLMMLFTLHSRFDLGRAYIANEVGFIGAVSNLFWSLGAGFQVL